MLDSCVVYSICDPEIEGDDSVFYIGLTSDFEQRIAQHMSPGSRKSAHPKDVKIREMLKAGVIPVFKKLAFDIPKELGPQTELYWIGFYLERSKNLTNRAIPNALKTGYVAREIWQESRARDYRPKAGKCAVCATPIIGTKRKTYCSGKCRSAAKRARAA
jgi:hypothetical protein